MPHKFNDARRHKFEKKRYRITNWPDYNENLRQRGDVTIWLSREVEAAWCAERGKTRGGQPVLFGSGNHSLPDAWDGLQTAAASDRRVCAQPC